MREQVILQGLNSIEWKAAHDISMLSKQMMLIHIRIEAAEIVMGKWWYGIVQLFYPPFIPRKINQVFAIEVHAYNRKLAEGDPKKIQTHQKAGSPVINPFMPRVI